MFIPPLSFENMDHGHISSNVFWLHYKVVFSHYDNTYKDNHSWLINVDLLQVH
jgi:hypothetical protein